MLFRFREALVLLCAGACALAFVSAARAAEPIVILVGVDGFRNDYLAKFQPPNLTELAKQGVTAERMNPSFPTLTFPNFYTIATGLRPEHHGIIGNFMFDPEFNETFGLGTPSVEAGKWWEGEPIWVTAQRQGLRAACMFWPGSEAEIGGMRPWDWRKYDAKVTPEESVRAVLDWLALPEKDRPRLITLYFHETDTAGHKFGPASKEVGDEVGKVDAAIGMLREGVHRLGLDGAVNYIVVADHGMAEVSPDRVLVLSELIEPSKVQIDFVGAVAGLRPAEGTTAQDIQKVLAAKQNHFTAYLRDQVPEQYHYRAHRRIPSVVLVAEEGWTFLRIPLTGQARDTFPKGAHGFPPDSPSMGAAFIASGPAFKKDVTLPPFDNIQVYNVACAVLGITPAKNDGDRNLLKQILDHPPK